MVLMLQLKWNEKVFFFFFFFINQICILHKKKNTKCAAPCWPDVVFLLSQGNWGERLKTRLLNSWLTSQADQLTGDHIACADTNRFHCTSCMYRHVWHNLSCKVMESRKRGSQRANGTAVAIAPATVGNSSKNYCSVSILFSQPLACLLEQFVVHMALLLTES